MLNSYIEITKVVLFMLFVTILILNFNNEQEKTRRSIFNSTKILAKMEQLNRNVDCAVMLTGNQMLEVNRSINDSTDDKK